MTEILKDIIDDDDRVIGHATRSEVQQRGLLHRGIKVFFITPSGNIIFQRRNKNKDVCPGLLDSTAGGGVDQGENYIEAAIRETGQETGVVLRAQDLVRLDKKKINYLDPLSGLHIYCYSEIFGYVYRGSIDSLMIEGGSGAGFVEQSIQTLWDQPVELYIPFLLDQHLFGPIYEQLRELIK